MKIITKEREPQTTTMNCSEVSTKIESSCGNLFSEEFKNGIWINLLAENFKNEAAIFDNFCDFTAVIKKYYPCELDEVITKDLIQQFQTARNNYKRISEISNVTVYFTKKSLEDESIWEFIHPLEFIFEHLQKQQLASLECGIY